MAEILFALWFFAPAGYANMAPIIANNIPWIANWQPPMDFGKSFRGKRVFGSHKTWRGLVAGVLAGAVIGALQVWLYRTFGWAQDIAGDVDYGQASIILMGGVMGLGALVGDALKSFFKRQVGVTPGKNWVPFDQIDFIVGGLLFSVPFLSLSFTTYLTTFIVMTLLHPVVNLLGWVLRLKNKPF